ncbi:MAG: EAL domain-containing protein [Trueperaceae bacterium]|nr:EAL domain-containing protein [Trueperaceae bacterium]
MNGRAETSNREDVNRVGYAMAFDDEHEGEGSDPSGDRRDGHQTNLSARERHFADVADAAPAVLWLSAPDGRMTYFSRAWYESTGQSRHDSLHGDWTDVLHPDDVEAIRAQYQSAIDDQRAFKYDYRLLHRDGSHRWVNDSGRPRFDAGGTYLGHIGTIIDVHALVLQSEALRERERHLARMTEFRRSVMELVEQGLATRDPEAFYQHMLERAVAVIDGAEAGSLMMRSADGMFDFVAAVGYDLDALRVVRFPPKNAGFGRLHKEVRPAIIEGPLPPPPATVVHGEILRTVGRTEEIRCVLAIPIVIDGVPTAVLTLDSFSSHRAFSGEATEMARIFGAHAATLFRRFALEAELHELAYHDALTGLANRGHFVEALDDTLASAPRDTRVAVLFVDLDDLKPINDSLGHRAGDDVLRAVAQRLTGVIGEDGLVARLGGDEFTVMLTGPTAGDAQERADGILAALDAPVQSGTHQLHIGASIGISRAPQDGHSAEDLLRRSDMAMYEAKTQSKGDVRTFTPPMEMARRASLTLEEALRRALDRNEFELHYQPRVDMATGRIVLLQAMLRWRHPERGLLTPEAFLDVADRAHLLRPLEDRALEMAAREARGWREGGAPGVRVAVTIAARHLERANLVREIEEILHGARLPPEALELEVLERAALTDVASRAARLADLRRAGVRVALAGFGRGHGTLSHLRVLPLDTLKIDRAFVRGLRAESAESAARDLAIVRTVAVLGRALGLRVVAEGVEDLETWKTLVREGAHEAQGYLLSPPVPADRVPDVLAAGPFRPGQ